MCNTSAVGGAAFEIAISEKWSPSLSNAVQSAVRRACGRLANKALFLSDAECHDRDVNALGIYWLCRGESSPIVEENSPTLGRGRRKGLCVNHVMVERRLTSAQSFDKY